MKKQIEPFHIHSLITFAKDTNVRRIIIKTRAPPTGALYATRKCSPPFRKTRIFISKYL